MSRGDRLGERGEGGEKVGEEREKSRRGGGRGLVVIE